MNDTPPTDDQGDEVEKLYRQSSAQYPSRPGAKARQAILEHSARLATRSAIPIWRRPVLFASLAAAALAGLLIGPQFLGPGAPPVALRRPPATATSALKSAKSTVPPASAVAESSESAPTAMNLPVTVPARDAPAPAMQVAPRAAAAAPVNPDQAASGARAQAALSGMRARQAPYARGADPSGSEAVADAAAPIDIDARDSDGRTALLSAVLQGRLDKVVALLRRGADPNAADLAGVTPLQAARVKQLPEIADALLRAGAR